MKTTTKIFLGTFAAWISMLINLLSQLFLVPIYLSKWGASTFGLWLTFQSVVSLLEIIDSGHQGFLQNEFLRIGLKRKRLLHRVFSSSIPIGLLIGLIQIIIGLILLNCGLINKILDLPNEKKEISKFIIIPLVTWALTGSVLGISGRLLSAIGYYSVMSWVGVGVNLVNNLVIFFAVVNNASLSHVIIIQSILNIFVNILVFLLHYKLLKSNNLHHIKPKFVVGVNNFYKSFLITFTAILDMARQDGMRILITPLANSKATASFSTTRTGVNIVQQGMGSITGPLIPELMHNINIRNQEKTDSIFFAIWAIVALILIPGAVIIQYLAPILFPIWTKNKVNYDPYIFSYLSISIIVYAFAQPAYIIVQGNNDLYTRILVSVFSISVLITSLFILLPILGIQGAAIALLLCELISSISYMARAFSWMKEHNMKWPKSLFSRNALAIMPGIILIYLSHFNSMNYIGVKLISLMAYLVSCKMIVENIPGNIKEKIKIVHFRKLKT